MKNTVFVFTILLCASLFAQKKIGNDMHIPVDPSNISPLQIGSQVPDIIYQGVDNKPFDVKKSLQDKPLILIYYRGEWCPYCNRQLSVLMEIETVLLDLGYRVIAVSPDVPEYTAKTVDKYGMHYELMSDPHLQGAKKLGIVFKLDSNTIEFYDRKGFALDKHAGDDNHLLPVPAVFIIDKKGIIRFVFADPDYKVRITNEALLKNAKEFK